MKHIEHIAVATDFSETADQAVDVTRRLATAFGARVSLVHVFDPAPLGPAMSYPAPVWTGGHFDHEMKQRADDLLEQTRRDRLSDLPDVGLHALHHTSPVMAVSDLAKTQDVDLVVTGTHGRTGLDHLLMGSIAERVVRHAPCSVLTVRSRLALETFPKSILVCTDFSPASEAALDQGAELARVFKARVTLCHVYDEEPSPLLRRSPEFRRLESDGELEGALGRALDEIVQGRFGGQADRVILHGDAPAELIANHAAAQGFDLVVVASHGRTGLARLVIGSVAEKVARLAPRAVWTARSPDDSLS